MSDHKYRSWSWRGSWPVYRCVFCGCNSDSDASRKPCPDAPNDPTTTDHARAREASGHYTTQSEAKGEQG